MTYRNLFLAIFLLCTALLAAAFYFQYVVGLNPCPLCILQRIAFMVCGAMAVIAYLHNPRALGRRIYAAGMAVASWLGVAVAARHVWLQNLPEEQVPECGPGLGFILDVFPLGEAVNLILRGSGECAEVQWTFLYLTMPGWALLWLILLGGMAIFMLVRG